MFQFFQDRTIPPSRDVRHIEFVTASPAVSADCHWVHVHSQIRPWEISQVEWDVDPVAGQLRGRTTNVRALAIDLRHWSNPSWNLELDGTVLNGVPRPAEFRLWLERRDNRWQVSDPPHPSRKGPHRYGGFKDAFRRNVVFVYGTRGTDEENAWALQKARFDAETFWYRGNGAIEVIPDQDFDSGRMLDRNVILYGHADMNSAWDRVLEKPPIQVRRGKVVIGPHELAGDDLGCLFVYPRSGSSEASVGVVAGSGLPGLRSTIRLPYFVSGVGYPDFVVLRTTAWTKGLAGIEAAGYFGHNWEWNPNDSVISR